MHWFAPPARVCLAASMKPCSKLQDAPPKLACLFVGPLAHRGTLAQHMGKPTRRTKQAPAATKKEADQFDRHGVSQKQSGVGPVL